MNNPFHDIEIIKDLNTTVNFLIKCEDDVELEELKKMLSTKKRTITFKEFKDANSDNNKQFKV